MRTCPGCATGDGKMMSDEGERCAATGGVQMPVRAMERHSHLAQRTPPCSLRCVTNRTKATTRSRGTAMRFRDLAAVCAPAQTGALTLRRREDTGDRRPTGNGVASRATHFGIAPATIAAVSSRSAPSIAASATRRVASSSATSGGSVPPGASISTRSTTFRSATATWSRGITWISRPVGDELGAPALHTARPPPARN